MLRPTRSPYPSINRRTAIQTLLAVCGMAPLAACAPAPTPSPAPVTSLPPTQAPATPKTLRSVDLRLSWTAFGAHAPYWVAVEKGYFAENGLDVKVLEGKGSLATLQLVANGQEPVGELDAGVMLPGIQKGMDVRMVACLYQRNTFGIVSPADAPILKPEDLKGKKLAAAPGAVGEVMWPAFVKRVGLDPSEVTLVNTDASGKIAAVLSRKVDGAFHQAPIDAITYEAQNFPVRQLLYADHGLDRLGNGIVVLNKTIKESPDMLRGLLAALTKGHQYAAEHPDEAAVLGKKLFTTSLSEDTLEKHWRAILRFTRTERTRDKPLFWMDKLDWENTQNALVEVDFLPERRPVETYYTNDLLS